jgi:hypothetical protein
VPTDSQRLVGRRARRCCRGGTGALRPESVMVKWPRIHIALHAVSLRKLGTLKSWQSLDMLKKLGPVNVFFVLAIGAAFWAHWLQGGAFPGAGSNTGQISATVYVETLPAQVNLQSVFTPSDATNNVSFSVTVKGPTKKPDPWLLLIQCPTASGQAPKGAVQLWSDTAVGGQKIEKVLVVPGPRKEPIKLTCFTGLSGQGQTAETVIQNRDLNLSLPTLEQDPAGLPILAGEPLYAEKAYGTYQNVVEVHALPGARCPTPSPSPASPSASSSSSEASTPSLSPTVTPSLSPTQTSSPSPTATSSSSPAASSPPSPSATASAAPSPTAVACYTQVLPGATSVKYSFPPPTDVVTGETLNNVKLADERIDSMYPPGNITTDQVIWQGSVDLGPSLNATNLSSAANQNKDAFFAGLLYGITAALAIPFFQELFNTWRNRKERGKGQQQDNLNGHHDSGLRQ